MALCALEAGLEETPALVGRQHLGDLGEDAVHRGLGLVGARAQRRVRRELQEAMDAALLAGLAVEPALAKIENRLTRCGKRMDSYDKPHRHRGGTLLPLRDRACLRRVKC